MNRQGRLQHLPLSFFSMTMGLAGLCIAFTLLLFTQFKRFIGLPFSPSSWAYSFPLASITVASWLMFELTGKSIFQQIALLLLAILSLIVFTLSIRTVQAARAGEICVPD